MNKLLKKVLSSLITLSLVAGSVVMPITASADDTAITPMVAGDTVVKEWKFDFGSADDVMEGYTAVTADRNYVTAKDYGFLGIDEEGYKLANSIDGFGNQKGQIIELGAGGGTGLNDGIGVIGAGGTGENEGKDIYGNQGDKYYPLRFALKVEDEQFFRVKATVTTLDTTKDANVSIYTARKHPIIKNTTVAAGETKTVEFSVRTTPIYYKGISRAIADEMVNVCVLGENSALASLEIQQVEKLPVMWVLGDSTVTDGNTTLPFVDYQNYTGVGTGLTMYLPRTMAMVNEGEGGLDAHDNNHYNMVASRIQAGDYMYVEYGHNHKTDGTSGYLSALDKYYNKCHEVGAKLLIVSPIERINQWDSATSTYTQSLNGFADTGEQYVADKVAAGATDIAYVDLNDYSINWYNKITADNDNSADAIKYYFQTGKGAGTDRTHPNDAGAEHLAYEFFKAAKAVEDETQKAVVEGFLTNMTDETPTLISEDVMAGGVGGSAWPTYIVPTDEKYPVLINDIVFDESGAVTSVTVEKRDAEITMDSYGIIVITILDENGAEKGKIYAQNQVDNSNPNGTYTITGFSSDVTLGESDTYTAVVMKAKDTESGVIVDEEANLAYSAVYKPTEIAKQLLSNEDKDSYEDFDYYGAVYSGDSASQLNDYNSWSRDGSAGIDLSLGETDDFKYATIKSDGSKNGSANQGSCYIAKALDSEIGTSGRYMISADFKYVSGGGLNVRLVTGHSSKNLGGTEGMTAFTINSDGKVSVNGTEVGTIAATSFTNVKYILDMDLGTATVSVGGGDETVINIDGYQTKELTVSPSKISQFMFDGSKVAYEVKVANLMVAQLKDVKLPTYSVSVAPSNAEWGSANIVRNTSDETETASLMSDNSAITMTCNYGGGVTVESTGAASAVVIVAEYENGALKSFKLNPVEFTEAGTKTIDAAVGAKVMLWESMSTIAPLAEAGIVPETTPEPTPTMPPISDSEESLPINTVVTLNAQANTGYVFMGWKTVDDELVSSDVNYSFRLRENTNLVASFVKEPGVEDITNYSLSATSSFVSAKAGTTTTMVIVDPVDADGTPMSKVTNADITWSTDNDNVTVDANGVVTIGEGYTTGDAATATVTVTGALNGITKTFKITTYSYAYYEEMTDGATNFDGLFMTIANKTAIVFPGASTTKTYKLAAPVALDKATTISYDHAWSGANTCGQSRTLNFKNSSGTTIFSMYYSWGGLYVNGTEMASAVSKDSWSTVKVEVDPTENTVTVTVGENTQTTTLADNAGDLASIEFASAGSVPGPEARALGVSKIVIEQ